VKWSQVSAQDMGDPADLDRLARRYMLRFTIAIADLTEAHTASTPAKKPPAHFRTRRGAQMFCRIRSYLSTCRNQGRNLWQASQRAVGGQPFLPSCPPAGP